MIEIEAIMPTTFEDGSSWLIYKQDGKFYGYELTYQQKEVDSIARDKILIDDLKIKNLVYDVLYSDNEMLYIDECDDKAYFEECKTLIEEDLKLHPELKDFIGYESFNDDTDTIVITGGIIVKCLFPIY